jgi:putative SOS response-associated peptidase YedK
MCGRVIQSSAPIRYAIVDRMNVRDSRVANYPPRWNGAPSQELLVIRRNHKTGEVSLDPLRWGHLDDDDQTKSLKGCPTQSSRRSVSPTSLSIGPGSVGPILPLSGP